MYFKRFIYLFTEMPKSEKVKKVVSVTRSGRTVFKSAKLLTSSSEETDRILKKVGDNRGSMNTLLQNLRQITELQKIPANSRDAATFAVGTSSCAATTSAVGTSLCAAATTSAYRPISNNSLNWIQSSE